MWTYTISPLSFVRESKVRKEESILTFFWNPSEPTGERDKSDDWFETTFNLKYPRFFTWFQNTPPHFKLSPRLRWVQNDYKLSQLSYLWLVQDFIKLFYLGLRSTTYGNSKLVFLYNVKLLNSRLRCSVLSFTLSPHEMRRATTICCKSIGLYYSATKRWALLFCCEVLRDAQRDK